MSLPRSYLVLNLSILALGLASAQADAANLVRSFVCATDRDELNFPNRFTEIIREYDDHHIEVQDHSKDSSNYDDRPDHTVSATAQLYYPGPGAWARYSLIQKNTFPIEYGCGATTQCTVEPKVTIRETIDVNLAHPEYSREIHQMEFDKNLSRKEREVSADTALSWFNRDGRANDIYCVDEARWRNHTPPALPPGEVIQCQDVSVDLRKEPIGFKCQTSKGAVFERVDAGTEFGEAWKDGDLIWSQTFDGPRLRGEGGAYYSDAKVICEGKGGTLPSRAEAEKGIADGLSEVVTDVYHTFYTSTLAPPGTTDITQAGDYISYGGKLTKVGSTEPNNAFGAARCVRPAR